MIYYIEKNKKCRQKFFLTSIEISVHNKEEIKLLPATEMK